MKQSTKAVLLSALIFPGIGQISIGHKKRGWLIIFTGCIFLYLIISKVLQQTTIVVEKMQKSGVALDIESISQQTSDLTNFSDNSTLNTLLIFFIVYWLFSIIDAYRIGKNNNHLS